MSSIRRKKSAKPIKTSSIKDCPSTKPLFNEQTGNCIADTWNNRHRLAIIPQKKSSSFRAKSSSPSITNRANHTQSKKAKKPSQKQNQNTAKISISERRAKAIARAIHSNGNGDDEAVDTFENLANERFASVDAIVNKIINLDNERFKQGWGRGELRRETVADAVERVLGVTGK